MLKPYLVMGANGGIGEALANRLAAAGNDLILTARDTRSLSHLQGRHLALDVHNPEGFAALGETAAEYEDGIAGLAYCVGSIVLKPFNKAGDQDFNDAFNLNVMGVVQALRACQAQLKKGQGSVVLFSTVAVQKGFTSHSVIASAKGAVEALTRSLAAEWAPHIRVNCIAPSLTDTEIAKPVTSSEKMAEGIAKSHPIPRLGRPDDCAAMAQFLLGPDSGWITGEIFHVDGGRNSIQGKG
jgi:NAD(P)-dependent dehydrogenase (short-subunit alcohol dehydrogenase family)